MATLYHTGRPLAVPSPNEALFDSPALRHRALHSPIRRPRKGSRLGAFGCIGLSTLACAASLTWILATPSDQSLPSTAFHARLVWGTLGALLSLAAGVAGIVLWPQRRRTSARPQETAPSTYDSMTGLPTHRLFLVLLSQVLTRAKHTRRLVAVLVIALEQCRPLATAGGLQNLTLVVRVQAARIKGALQSHDTVARLGEHRFAVILDGVEGADGVRSIAENIQRAMSLPLIVEGHELLLSCRIGAALGPCDGSESEALLAGATQALDSQSADASIKFLSDVTALTPAVQSTSGVVLPPEARRSPALTAHR